MKRFAFFPGCMIPVRYPAMEFAVRYTMPKLGIEIVDMPGASCCPDPIYFKAKDKLSWLTVAARNLVIAENMGLDIFTICSGCTATLQEASNLLKDEKYRKTVNARLAKIGMEYKGTVKVRHVVSMLRDEVGVEKIRETVVRPLTDLKVNPNRVVKHATEVYQPMLLTSWGRGAVVQSVSDYEKAEEERVFTPAVVAGLADLEAGHEVSLDEARVRLGLK